MLDSAKDVLRKYISDMVGVVRHVHEAVERQMHDNDAEKFPEARVLLTALSSELNTQRSHLDGLATEVDAAHFASAKEAVTAATGFLTGLYDHLRSHPISKDLRDDYVAVTLCCVAYEMLHTTGLAVQHAPTAELALRHLRQLTPYVSQIGQLIPQVVVRELAERGVAVDSKAADVAAQNNHGAWRAQV
jgi:hypothetical protein